MWTGTVAVGMFGYVDFNYFWLIIAQFNNVNCQIVLIVLMTHDFVGYTCSPVAVP